jgi:hypothetical protein
VVPRFSDPNFRFPVDPDARDGRARARRGLSSNEREREAEKKKRNSLSAHAAREGMWETGIRYRLRHVYATYIYTLHIHTPGTIYFAKGVSGWCEVEGGGGSATCHSVRTKKKRISAIQCHTTPGSISSSRFNPAESFTTFRERLYLLPTGSFIVKVHGGMRGKQGAQHR